MPVWRAKTRPRCARPGHKVSAIAVNAAGVGQAIPVVDIGATVIGTLIVIGMGRSVVTRKRRSAWQYRRADHWRDGRERRREQHVGGAVDQGGGAKRRAR